MPNLVPSLELVVRRRKTTHYPLPTTNYKVKRGFTLIELLVVISIIGILAAAAIVSYGSAQERSRDSRRKTDLDAIKKALELYKQDTAGAYYYPQLLTSLAPTYINVLPTDPKFATNYIYAPLNAADAACTTDCVKYSLTACLENSADQQKDAIKNSACTQTPASYTVIPY